MLAFRFLNGKKFVLFTVFLDIARILPFANFTEELLEVIVKSSTHCLFADLGLIPLLKAFKVDCTA